jgi:hypothetical protein
MGTVVSTGFVRGLMDKWPLADDSYWLGSTDKGWKGIYFPDLKLYQYDATTLSIGTITGGSFLDISGDGTKVTLLPATGVYTRIGDAGVTSHALAANDDLFVSGKLEVDGTTILDGVAYLYNGFYAYNNLILSTNAVIDTSTTNDEYYLLRARDNGVGQVEIARAQSAADPYFRVGRDDTGVALNSVTDMLVLQAGAGTNNEAANFGFGLVVKLGNAASEVEERCSIDFVLTNAGNGTEATEINFNVMTGGGMVERASIDAKGITFASSVVSSSGVDEVSIGGYDVAVGHRTLAVSTEETVVAATTQAFSGYIPVCWNGTTVRIAFCTT